MNPEQETNMLREEENELNLIDMYRVVRANWYWFLLSVAVCCAVAVLYLGWAPKIYQRTATVLIKDDTKGGGAASEAAVFEDLNMFNMKRSVDNELLVFKSKQLMKSVVKRLDLDISYSIREGLRTVELYSHSPVVVRFPEANENLEFGLTVVPVSDKEVSLSGFFSEELEEEGQVQEDQTLTVALNDTVSTPIGKVVVTPSLYYTDLYYGSEITVSKSNQDRVALDYNESLQVVLASKTATILNLSLQDVSASRAEDVLNTLIAIYNEDAISDKNQVMVNTSNFINDRLIIIEKELGNVDAEIEVFKRENQLTDIHSEAGMYLQEGSQYSQEGLGLENQLTLAKYIREYLTDPHKGADLIPANTGISDVSLESQISEYNTLLLKRDKLIGNSSNRNPVVMDLNNSLGAMKQTIIRAVDNLIVGLNIKIKNIREREVQTTRRIAAVPTQQKYVLSVERQQKIKEELYLYLLNKREENALSQAITESNARIIDPAQGSEKPVAPKSMLVLLAACVLGMVVPSGILWVQLTMNTTVRSRKDIEDNLSVPFLGEIPSRNRKDKSEILVHENGRDGVSEAFRIVRTNMEFMRVKAKDLKVVMFTSSNPGAGKTFVSMNLAMSFVLTNKKVILVDTDIRKGTLSARISHAGAGLTHYLSGRVDDVDKIIAPSGINDRLDVIHAGPVPPNPSELLLSNRLEELVNTLRERYDYVILDNVPAGMVADATIVNRVADLTVYVIRAGLMDRRQLPEVEKLYKQEKFRNMAVILNGINMKRAGYGYGNEKSQKHKK